jgi:hypothetical protein
MLYHVGLMEFSSNPRLFMEGKNVFVALGDIVTEHFLK